MVQTSHVTLLYGYFYISSRVGTVLLPASLLAGAHHAFSRLDSFKDTRPAQICKHIAGYGCNVRKYTSSQAVTPIHQLTDCVVNTPAHGL